MRLCGGFASPGRHPIHPEWYSTFARLGDNSYVVLHLRGERRLYGYAEEWPGSSKEGHFRIAEPEWLGEERQTGAAHDRIGDLDTGDRGYYGRIRACG